GQRQARAPRGRGEDDGATVPPWSRRTRATSRAEANRLGNPVFTRSPPRRNLGRARTGRAGSACPARRPLLEERRDALAPVLGGMKAPEGAGLGGVVAPLARLVEQPFELTPGRRTLRRERAGNLLDPRVEVVDDDVDEPPLGRLRRRDPLAGHDEPRCAAG